MDSTDNMAKSLSFWWSDNFSFFAKKKIDIITILGIFQTILFSKLFIPSPKIKAFLPFCSLGIEFVSDLLCRFPLIKVTHSF